MQYVAEQAYSPYLPRMGGLRPGPMDTDYRTAVAESEAWVAESEGEVVGFLLLVAEEDGMLLENVAVLPPTTAEASGARSSSWPRSGRYPPATRASGSTPTSPWSRTSGCTSAAATPRRIAGVRTG